MLSCLLKKYDRSESVNKLKLECAAVMYRVYFQVESSWTICKLSGTLSWLAVRLLLKRMPFVRAAARKISCLGIPWIPEATSQPGTVVVS